MSLDEEWLNFQTSTNTQNVDNIVKPQVTKKEMPKCSDIYISTQTKIAYLNQPINLNDVFWKLKVMEYHLPQNGVIKKSIKINCHSPEQVKELEENIKKEQFINVTILSQVNNPNARKNKFKDIRKIDIGINKKDLISYRKKQKGAFYNCFAIIMRILFEGEYKEVHVKIFNTGKLEIPGIQYDDLLTVTLENLVEILKPLTNKNIDYNKQQIQTVLINSNFSCGFFIDRFKLYQILKYKYNLHASYDPCSYPGIQCKFCYNEKNKIHDGVMKNENDSDSKWIKISFMIFRTGSVLIVGNGNKYILNIIYKFLRNILQTEYQNICIENNEKKKVKAKKKVRKRTILLDIE